MCLQALTIEKQQLLRQMELITFYTDDAEEIVQKYWTLLGEGDDNFKELENLISDSFNGIKDVSLFPRNISKTQTINQSYIYYILSTLNIDLILWHTQFIVCAEIC